MGSGLKREPKLQLLAGKPAHSSGNATLVKPAFRVVACGLAGDDGFHLHQTGFLDTRAYDQLVGGEAVEADVCIRAAPHDGLLFDLEVLHCFLGVDSAGSVHDDAPPACRCAEDSAVGREGFGGVGEGGRAGDGEGFTGVGRNDGRESVFRLVHAAIVRTP